MFCFCVHAGGVSRVDIAHNAACGGAKGKRSDDPSGGALPPGTFPGNPAPSLPGVAPKTQEQCYDDKAQQGIKHNREHNRGQTTVLNQLSITYFS